MEEKSPTKEIMLKNGYVRTVINENYFEQTKPRFDTTFLEDLGNLLMEVLKSLFGIHTGEPITEEIVLPNGYVRTIAREGELKNHNEGFFRRTHKRIFADKRVNTLLIKIVLGYIVLLPISFVAFSSIVQWSWFDGEYTDVWWQLPTRLILGALYAYVIYLCYRVIYEVVRNKETYGVTLAIILALYSGALSLMFFFFPSLAFYTFIIPLYVIFSLFGYA